MITPVITSIGEILWDIYPGKKRLGGAPFNFIYHAWKLLGKGNFISSVGNDLYGSEILDYLDKIGFDIRYISIDEKHPTGYVKVIIDGNKNPHFTISAESSYDYITLNQSSLHALEESDLIYFGTLSQRNNVTRSTIQNLFGMQKKFFCDLNLRHDFFTNEMIEAALRISHVLKVNDHELDKLKRFFMLSEDNGKAIEQLSNAFNIELIAVTFGENGALLYDGNNFSWYKTSGREIIDTLGAGDAFAALLCIGYLFNMPVNEINKLANEFAADICGIEGALPVNDDIYTKYRTAFKKLMSK
ncbi:MAG: carbohydrate kinase [Bacteroidota bacterium]